MCKVTEEKKQGTQLLQVESMFMVEENITHVSGVVSAHIPQSEDRALLQ